MGLGFRVQGLGCRVSGSINEQGFPNLRLQASGLCGLEFRAFGWLTKMKASAAPLIFKHAP